MFLWDHIVNRLCFSPRALFSGLAASRFAVECAEERRVNSDSGG